MGFVKMPKAPPRRNPPKSRAEPAKKPQRKKVYAVDFDGTISFGRFPNLGKPNEELIETLKFLRASGNKVVLWTTREGDYLQQAIDFCASYGLSFDAVNDNLPEVREVYGNPRKVAADLYISAKSFPYWSNGDKEDLCKLLPKA